MTDITALQAAHEAAVARSKFLQTLHCDLADAMEHAAGGIVVDKLTIREIDRLDCREFNHFLQRAVSGYLDGLISDADQALTDTARAVEEHEWAAEEARSAAA